MGQPELGTPRQISDWERRSRIGWKTSVRRGTIRYRESFVVQVRQHVAGVKDFLQAARASIADSQSSLPRAEEAHEATPYVWVHRL